jgi:hypothetical protein
MGAGAANSTSEIETLGSRKQACGEKSGSKLHALQSFAPCAFRSWARQGYQGSLYKGQPEAAPFKTRGEDYGRGEQVTGSSGGHSAFGRQL